MSQNPELLHFKFSNYGDSMLQKMNLLRKQNRFCDVTVHVNDLEVQGHKVVFAAGSPFLRDQFLLNDSKDIKISIFQSSEVGKQLLLSCYTGFLEFPEMELVNYLTAASFLQMGHIVERCTESLLKFIKPRDAPKDQGASSVSVQPNQENLSTEPVTVQDIDDKEEEDEEEEQDDVEEDVIMQPDSPSIQQVDDNTDGEDNAITIVKVESIGDQAPMSSGKLQTHFPSPAPTALHTPEPQHSLINSTVDTRIGEIVGSQAQSYSSSAGTDTLVLGKNNFGGYMRNQEKCLQWYHQCPKCARVFRQLENYANHLKMHKLFMCLLCGKTFTQKGNLHRHMRVHAGIKPFQCKICGKTFTQKCSLLDHLNLHSGDKPHKCNYCDMVFAHKPVLRKHLKQIHGKNSFDNANERNLQESSVDYEYGRAHDTDAENADHSMSSIQLQSDL
ncbi:zinc finger and BTB domain-containing protein 26 [Polypterus senegalus]|uniref:zinc finger and BTB domain-containing protein 26 n=1 Tax=Polypterus senegalus TaxID=55291 RepID=UPI0019639114|nr:zinc finger and BTB domain-containing protein 26 [Polypterus senegalus]